MVARLTRRSEGLSLLEALVALTIAALVLMTAFDITRRLTTDAARFDARLLARLERYGEDAAIRAVLSAMQQAPQRAPRLASVLDRPTGPRIVGDATSLSGPALFDAAGPCARGPGRVTVRLAIVQDGRGGGRLTCEAKGRARTLAAWRQGAARFTYYHREAGGFVPTWPPEPDAPDDPFLRDTERPSALIVFERSAGGRISALAVAPGQPGPGLTVTAQDEAPDPIFGAGVGY